MAGKTMLLTGRLLAILALLLLCPSAFAAGDRPAGDSLVVSHGVELDTRPGYLFQTSPFFRGLNLAGRPMRNTLSAHLRYSLQLDPAGCSSCGFPSVSQGVGIAYNSFFNRRELGDPVSVYVFQRVKALSLAPKLSFDLEWALGLSFGWRPFNIDDPSSPEYNEFNTVVGSRVNAYIGLGFLLDYRIDRNWSMVAGVDLSHYSNGNTTYPNAGVNTVGLRLGAVRSFVSAPERASRYVKMPSQFTRHVSYDLVVYGSYRFKGVKLETDPFLVPGKFAVAGLYFSPMYNFSPIFRAGLSLDARYDESANIAAHAVNPWSQQTKFYRPPFIEQISVGVSARAELVMPVFSVSLGVGRNFVCTGPDTDGFYQIAALKVFLTRSLFIHVGYQLFNFHEPNNLMLGAGFRFNDKR